MSNNVNGTLYYILKTHDKVSRFRECSHFILKYPDQYSPVLVSIATQLILNDKCLSVKQVNYALSLIRKTELSELFRI
jgi:hypothetical protein